MKELKKPERIYIEDFDIYVKPRLLDAEIQKICNNVIKFKTWAEREKTINLMTFIYATEIADKEDEITKWEDYYYSKFSSMESALAKLNQTQSSLAGYFS